MWLQVLFNGIGAGAVYALVAISVALVLQSSRFTNFGIGGLMALSASLFYQAARVWHWNWLAAILAALALTSLVSAGFGWAVFTPMRRNRAHPLSFVIASLGALIALEGLLGFVLGGDPLVLVSGGMGVVGTWLGVRLGLQSVCAILLLLTVLATLTVFLEFTRTGRSLRALADDADLAASLGLSSERLIGMVFVISGVIAAGAGLLAGLEREATPNMGFRPLLMGIAGMVVGGANRVQTAAAGGVALGVVEHLVGTGLPGDWQDTFVFGILIATLMIRPRGVLGRTG